MCCRSASVSQSGTARRATHNVSHDTADLVGLHVDEFDEQQMSMCANIHSVNRKSSHPPIAVHLLMNEMPLSMEVDTGAHVSLIPQAIWAKSWSHVPLKPCITKLCTFSGSPISVVGEAEVAISYGHQSARLNVVIVKEGKIALFGRNWLNKISLDWHSILAVHKCSESQSVSVLDEFPSLFEDGLGKVEGKEANIQLSEGAIPKCMSARLLPYAMKAKVEVELDRLIDEAMSQSNIQNGLHLLSSSRKRTIRSACVPI